MKRKCNKLVCGFYILKMFILNMLMNLSNKAFNRCRCPETCYRLNVASNTLTTQVTKAFHVPFSMVTEIAQCSIQDQY